MLTVAELKKAREKRAAINHETYKKIYTDCIHHIKNKEAVGCSEAVFTVPAFVVGRPPYEFSHAMRYVTDKLRLGKFNVNPTGNPGEVHVEWGSVRFHGSKLKKRKARKQKPKQAVEEPLSVKLERIKKTLGY